LIAIVVAVAAAACSSDKKSSAPTTTTVTPRPADAALGLSGRAVFDGAPFSSDFLGAVVKREGLVTPCQAEVSAVFDGTYQMHVLTDQQSAGCGTAGSQIVLWTFTKDAKVYSTGALNWFPGAATAFDVEFSAAHPNGALSAMTELSGEARDANGNVVAPGALVEAFVGSAKCGVGSVRKFDASFTGYTITVVGPDAIPGCTKNATISFRVGGKPARETYKNTLAPPPAGTGGKFPLTQA
jgi:hypothetical protein